MAIVELLISETQERITQSSQPAPETTPPKDHTQPEFFTITDKELLTSLSSASENTARRMLDKKIGRRRPVLERLNGQLAQLNNMYPIERTSSGRKIRRDFGPHLRTREIILNQKRAISAAQAFDRIVLTEQYLKPNSRS